MIVFGALNNRGVQPAIPGISLSASYHKLAVDAGAIYCNDFDLKLRYTFLSFIIINNIIYKCRPVYYVCYVCTSKLEMYSSSIC